MVGRPSICPVCRLMLELFEVAVVAVADDVKFSSSRTVTTSPILRALVSPNSRFCDVSPGQRDPSFGLGGAFG